jgi:hypothetical protein
MSSYTTTTHTSRKMHPKAQAEYLQTWEDFSKKREQSSPPNIYAMPAGGKDQFLGKSYEILAAEIAANKSFQEWKSKVTHTPTSSRASSTSRASTSPPPVKRTSVAPTAPRQRPARQSLPRNQVSRQAPALASTTTRPREMLPATTGWGNFSALVEKDDAAHVANAHANKQKFAGQLCELTAMYKNKEGKADVDKFEKVGDKKTE